MGKSKEHLPTNSTCNLFLSVRVLVAARLSMDGSVNKRLAEQWNTMKGYHSLATGGLKITSNHRTGNHVERIQRCNHMQRHHH